MCDDRVEKKRFDKKNKRRDWRVVQRSGDSGGSKHSTREGGKNKKENVLSKHP